MVGSFHGCTASGTAEFERARVDLFLFHAAKFVRARCGIALEAAAIESVNCQITCHMFYMHTCYSYANLNDLKQNGTIYDDYLPVPAPYHTMYAEVRWGSLHTTKR